MSDNQLLIPAPKAAKKLGMSRRSLQRRIDAKDIKAVRVGPRAFIPWSEIDRLLGIPAAQISAPKPATENQVSRDTADRGHTWTTRDNYGANQGRFCLDELLDRMSETMYDGPRGVFLREYHAALKRWRTEFHKADKDPATVDALWAVVLPAYRDAFGKEPTPDDVKTIRRFDEYEEEEKIRKATPAQPNPCVTTNIR